MSQAPAIAVAPSRTLLSTRRGACPTLAQPMQTGDGLLARFRPVGAALSPTALAAIARAAERFGNGMIEITARGSLQIRGMRRETTALLAEAIESAGDVEHGTPVETPPLAGLDPAELQDPRPLAATLRRAIAGAGLAGRLGAKVTVIVDGGGRYELSGLAADVRVEAMGGGWQVTGAGPARALHDASRAVAEVLARLERIAALGPAARGRDFGDESAPDPSDARLPSPLRGGVGGGGLSGEHEPPPPDPLRGPPSSQGGGEQASQRAGLMGGKHFPAPVGTIDLGHGHFALGFALGFGSAPAENFLKLAKASEAAGASELRLAPGRGLYVAGLAAGAIAPLRTKASELGFTVDAADPRLAVSACIGSAGCASGHIAARALAHEIAGIAPTLLDGSFDLHVSGCAKGCAHPRPALMTLSAAPGGLALIIDGTASGEAALSLAPEAAVAGLARLERLYRARAYAQESACEWLKRLGPDGIAAAFE